MKTHLIFISALVSGMAFAAQSPLNSASFGHPILGTWTWTRSTNQCTEVYEFKLNGEAHVQSDAERSDNTFSITNTPDANGFYKIDMRITKDFGGKDCADDEADNTGSEFVNYIKFSPDKSMYVACESPTLERCFGPLRRVPPKQ